MSDARVRCADLLRDLIGLVATGAAPDSAWEQAAAALSAAHDALRPFGGAGRYAGGGIEVGGSAGASLWSSHPLLGAANALAPPLRLEPVGGQMVGRVRFGGSYEGAPGRVHGGYLAAVFDAALAQSVSLTDCLAVTGTLTVVYRAPLPLDVEARVTARPGTRTGRTLPVTGELHVGDLLVARAEAVFVVVDPQTFRPPGDAARPPGVPSP